MSCFCGHSEHEHQEIPMADWNLRHALDQNNMKSTETHCILCGSKHYFDSDFGGFAPHGVQTP